MSSHGWTDQCPYCGFDGMSVSSYGRLLFEVSCQICGYAAWTQEKIPENRDVEQAKLALSKMGTVQQKKAAELYEEDGIPLIARLKGKLSNEQ